MRRARTTVAGAALSFFLAGSCASSLRARFLLCSSPRCRWLSSSSAPSPFPPPEWVDPFFDLSDVAATPSRDHRHPSPWLARVAALLRDSSSVESALDDYCRHFLIRLSPAFVSQALRNPDLRDRPEIALRFFRWAARQRHYRQHCLESYVALVEIFSSSPHPPPERDAVVRQLISEVRALGLLLTSPACGSLIKCLGAMAMVEDLLWVWRRMKESGGEASVWTYNCLLGGLVNASFLDSAEKVFDVMRSGEKPGIRPDVVSYNLMIKAYCRAGDTRAAMELLAEIDDAGKGGGGAHDGVVSPDKITYMMLIQAHYADGDSGACLRLYHEMEEKGLEVPSHAYSLVMGGLCSAGKPFEATALLERMAERGCRANVAIYTMLMDSFAKVGNERRAMELFERMKKEGLEPDEVTHGVVVNCLSKGGRAEEAAEWLRHCKDRGVPVNAVLYASVIDGLGKVGMVETAMKLFDEMVEEDGLLPDSFCYNALMDALCRAGRVDEALGLLGRMEREGCDQTVYTYTILLEGLFKDHRNEEALKLWDAMLDRGVTPSPVSFRVLCRGLCLSGKVASACRLLDELAPMGVVPETAHEDMIGVLCRAGRVEQACKLADGVVDRGREVPGRVRTIFINALRKGGKAELAIKLMHSKIGIGYDRVGSIKRRVKFQSLLK
ncbi:unnamed protein product [Spirodela intermedia]|uniref:Uncharacterized protein n=1 Tax=Spirodela intermedia TaxID=51605 RepID=A0A7I8KAH5_SPIIN|nr:unnamed protein product [Spirodela intermedia]